MKNTLAFIFAVTIALAVGIYVGSKVHFSGFSDIFSNSNKKKDKLNKLIDFIDQEYVDAINTDSIVDVTVNNILEKLDPHSVYITNEEMTRVTENMQGDFVGVGINFYNYKDTITVIRAIENGPSYKEGILAGDRILMAGKDTLYGKNITNKFVLNRLKGAEGTTVALELYRRSENKKIKVLVKRGVVPIKSVPAYYMMRPDLGYIKITRFAASTYTEFKQALTKLQKRGAKKLILDLRDNPGGYLNVAEQIADEFLGDGKLILFTKNKSGKIEKTMASAKGSFENKPIYVLINERSASASEVIAGALQDNDIGTIVGRRSFGKGLVQREMDLGDGSAVRLTVARYYTPTGRSIQKDYKKGTVDYYKRFTERYHSGELVSVDSIKVADSLKFVTPKGKVVYGGGGVIPDIFVPIGTNEEEAIRSMQRSGYLSYFIFEHLDEDRKRYSQYGRSEFIEDFKVDDILFQNFIDYAIKNRLRMDFYAYENIIKAHLKAALSEQLFGANMYAQLKGLVDPMLTKVRSLSRYEVSESAN